MILSIFFILSVNAAVQYLSVQYTVQFFSVVFDTSISLLVCLMKEASPKLNSGGTVIRKPSSVYYHKNEDLSTARIGGFLFNFFVYTVYQDSGFRGQGPESGTRTKELEVRSYKLQVFC